MGQSFCNKCGSRLGSSGNCLNVGCVAYSPSAMVSVVTAEVPTAPPTGPDLFAGHPDPFADPLLDMPMLSEPQVLPPATAPDRDWASAGDAGQNDFYVGNRLLFHPPEAGLNDTPELGIIRTAALRLAVIGSFVFFASLVISIVVAFIIGPKTAFVLFFLFNLAFVIARLFVPVRIPVSEWMLLLDNKGPAAESAFAQIASAFERRQAPVAPTARRVSFGGLGGIGAFASSAPRVRNYLAVRYGNVTGYISAFAFGNDLYVGWTLWWEQRPIRSFLGLIRQSIASTLGRDVQFQLILRADDAKALRELMHSAAREGIDVAARGLNISMAGTVGADVPVEAFQPAFEE
jgi:hypothetical protein